MARKHLRQRLGRSCCTTRGGELGETDGLPVGVGLHLANFPVCHMTKGRGLPRGIGGAKKIVNRPFRHFHNINLHTLTC
jgi:hypothetical protein